MKYKARELNELHKVLYEILNEIDRVCKVLKIRYFIIGGSAIGAFYYNGILPWDDDIDVGMLRSDYDRLIREASKVIDNKYTIQCYETENTTPYYWIKVRKNNTLFIEEIDKNLETHHGIYIDIFPFDIIPENKVLEIVQRNFVKLFNSVFIVSQVLCKSKYKRLSSFSYKTQSILSSLFNRKSFRYINIVKMPKDQILLADVQNAEMALFGSLNVPIPRNVEVYLKHHYKNLRKEIPEREQINHAPHVLDFGGNKTITGPSDYETDTGTNDVDA